MTFPEAVAYVSSLELRGWRLGLDRMEDFLRRAGLTTALTDIRYLHVAGTNGKGSVTGYVQSVLSHAGYRTGGYFSPFVYDIRERIQFGGATISEQDFTALVNRLRPVSDSFENDALGAITEFEFKTAMGFAYWLDKGADWVALEVGLGGRLDATNVISPACSAIVSIGLDHTAILGETLDAIAREKAGILKLGRPGVVGNLPLEALDAVRERAQTVGCPLWEFGREFGVDSLGNVFTPLRALALRPPIPGAHQLHNAAVAVAALDAAGANLSDDAIRTGIESTRIPGRFERREVDGKLVLLDGAHNAESMEALAETVLAEYPGQQWAVVFGMLDGHDPAPVVRQVERFAAEVHLSPIDFRRTRHPEDLAAYFSVPTSASNGAPEAFHKAMNSPSPVLVTGSFYLVGEVGRNL